MKLSTILCLLLLSIGITNRATKSTDKATVSSKRSHLTDKNTVSTNSISNVNTDALEELSSELESEDDNNEVKPERKEREQGDQAQEESPKKMFKLKGKRAENNDKAEKKKRDIQMQQSSSFQESSSFEQSSSFQSSTKNSSFNMSFNMNEVKMKQAKKWKLIFKTMDRKQSCSRAEQARVQKKKSEKDENLFLHTGLPFAKPSWDEKKFGRADAGYYFDFIDTCWQKRVSDTFKGIYQAAKQIPDDPASDPYSIENQLKVYSSMGLGAQIPQEMFLHKGPETQHRMEGLLAKINPKFNIDIYGYGITYTQLAKLLKEWNWISPAMADYADPAKHILDKFDWDGNGRLDPREFLFFSIKENTKMLGDKQKRKNFYDQFIDGVLEPFFTYADCDSDGLIDSENIWFASELLACRHPTKFDIYKCDAKASDANSDYRTSATNDLVLKNMKSAEAYLSKNEFYRAILLGFWDRQVTPRGILQGDEINGKFVRWGGMGPTLGEIDRECEAIKKVQMGVPMY